jgi:hypothetical protein
MEAVESDYLAPIDSAVPVVRLVRSLGRLKIWTPEDGVWLDAPVLPPIGLFEMPEQSAKFVSGKLTGSLTVTNITQDDITLPSGDVLPPFSHEDEKKPGGPLPPKKGRLIDL